ncbi:MAG TPA: hypothetical protein VK836_09035 [Streptosporangiaceae bacterium]|nr:hypothetical protein [Streptosporangiaceae bacterium]
MTASTLSAAAEAGATVADGRGWTALVDGGGADDVGEVGAAGVSVVRGAACGDGANVCGDETTVWDGVGRIDLDAAPAALPVAICTAISATTRTTTAAATARYAWRGAQARGRARWRGT